MFGLMRGVLSAISHKPQFHNLTSRFHMLSAQIIQQNTQLLAPITPSLVQNCGFKVKGKLRKRCKDCYLVCREERWYVLCKTHGRHKQMAMVKDPKNTWILSHATQSKVRPW